jgi:proline iminopeptidase
MLIEINGAPIFFDVVGSQLAIDGARMVERPTLLVLHGGPGFDHTTLRPYFDRFADTHQVVYLDHRGNGRSGGAPESWALAQWGDDIRAFCDTLGVVRPIVYGNSFGGMVAIAYATRHPEHPARLILSSTAARMHLDVTYAMMEQAAGQAARTVAEAFWTSPTEETRQAYEAICLPLYNPPSPTNANSADVGKRAIRRLEVLQHFVAYEMRQMDARTALAAIRCPTLILAGRHDPITPIAAATELLDSIGADKAALRIFETAGHGVHRDDPDGAESVLRGFLA